MTAFEKGNKIGKGRPRGAVNVTTRISNELTEECFERIGGIEAFAHWADRYLLRLSHAPQRVPDRTDLTRLRRDRGGR